MAYQLEQKEKLPEGLRRIVQEEMSQALAYLKFPLADKDACIHEVRKSFKKIRAVLKLIRYQVSDSFYDKENQGFRDRGRELSGIRDIAVSLETLKKLRKRVSGPYKNIGFSAILNKIHEDYLQAHDQINSPQSSPDEIRRQIRLAKRRWRRISIYPGDFLTIHAGLFQMYRQGRDQIGFLYYHPTDEGFHEWRKTVKNLWYHIRILQNIWPPVMDGLNQALHVLSEYLGEEHDLCELQRYLTGHDYLCASTREKVLLDALVLQKKMTLRSRAISLGRRIYYENPSSFCNRIQGYWEAWKAIS